MSGRIGIHARRTAAFDSASTRLFRAMIDGGGQINDQRRGVIDLTIRRLKDQGLWDKFDCLYMFAALDSVSALINWKNPGTFNCTLNNAPTFTADRGFTGNGSNANVATGFTPSTAAGVLVRDSAHISARSRSSLAASSSNRLVGPATSSNNLVILPRNTGDVAAFQLNDNSNGTPANATTLGHYLANRSGGSARQYYRDGASLGTDSTASGGLGTAEIRFLQFNNTHSSLQVASGSLGSSLTADEVAAFYGIETAYMQAVGAV